MYMDDNSATFGTYLRCDLYRMHALRSIYSGLNDMHAVIYWRSGMTHKYDLIHRFLAPLVG